MSKDIQEISNINSTSRLDVYLSSLIEDISRTKIKFLIDNGKIKVDDYIVKTSYRIKNDWSWDRKVMIIRLVVVRNLKL